jgi:hypothetical protein
MSSFRQIEANRRNAQLSTGPLTEDGKRRSRQNAVRYGLTAETVIDALEDAEDYAAFEMAVTADYDAQSAVERELVLRLASLLWRLRRATAIESGLFKIQARQLLQFRQSRQAHQKRQNMIDSITETRSPQTTLSSRVRPRSLAALMRARHQAQRQLIRQTILQAHFSACLTSRPIRLTDWRVMRGRFGVKPVRFFSRCSLWAAVSLWRGIIDICLAGGYAPARLKD